MRISCGAALLRRASRGQRKRKAKEKNKKGGEQPREAAGRARGRGRRGSKPLSAAVARAITPGAGRGAPKPANNPIPPGGLLVCARPREPSPRSSVAGAPSARGESPPFCKERRTVCFRSRGHPRANRRRKESAKNNAGCWVWACAKNAAATQAAKKCRERSSQQSVRTGVCRGRRPSGCVPRLGLMQCVGVLGFASRTRRK